MTLAEFKKTSTVEEVNTNNDWGFGGWVGKVYTMDKLVHKVREFCYRHAPSHTVREYFIDGVEVTKKEFEKALD